MVIIFLKEKISNLEIELDELKSEIESKSHLQTK